MATTGESARDSFLFDRLAAQAVQRCRMQSDTRYGAIHRLASSGNVTDCGLQISSGGWWILGDENRYDVTCRTCLRRNSDDK